MAKAEANDIFEYPRGVKLSLVHSGRTPASEPQARALAANALALNLRLPANRLLDIMRGQRATSAETALRLGRYFGTGAAFSMNLRSRYDVALAERETQEQISREVDVA